MKKEEKNHVGRPKLADNDTKKKAMLLSITSFLLVAVLLVGGFNTIAKTNIKKLEGASSLSSSIVETYSIVKDGQEPNKCDIRVLNLSGNTLKYQIRCQANARPMTVRLNNNGKKTIILKDFNMHKGYFAIHTYKANDDIKKGATLDLYYKKQYIVEKKDNKKYKVSEKIFNENGILNKKNEVSKSNSKDIPSSKCTISVSNVKSNSFNWTVKCDDKAKPESVRLVKKVNGKDGSQIAVLRKGYNNNYGITESKKVNKYIDPNTEYTVELYYGSKETGYAYYKTTVDFKTTKKTTTKKTTTKKTTTKKTTTSDYAILPDVAGMTSNDGRQILRNSGFFVQTSAVITYDKKKDGIIQKTSPSGGTSVKLRTAIIVYVYHYIGD